MVVPPERRATKQIARKTAASRGFAPVARLASLLALRMITEIRHGSAPCSRATGCIMRLMIGDETGSPPPPLRQNNERIR